MRNSGEEIRGQGQLFQLDARIERKKKIEKSAKVMFLIIFVIVLFLIIIKWIIPTITRYNNIAKYREEGYIEKDVTRYLEERYGEEFVITSVRGRSYAYDYINMYAYPKSHQEEAYEFKIQGRYNEEGILEYTDSYVMIKLRDDYEAYVDPIIDEYFDEYKFYIDFDSEWMTSNIPANAKLEDLWELKANEDYPLPWLHLYLKSSEQKHYNKSINMQLATELQKKNYRGVFATSIYYDDAFYDKRCRTNVYENIGVKKNDGEGTMLIIHSDTIKE